MAMKFFDSSHALYRLRAAMVGRHEARLLGLLDQVSSLREMTTEGGSHEPP